jgi:hypothetical protein
MKIWHKTIFGYSLEKRKEDMMKKIIRAGTVLVAALLASNAVALETGDLAPDFTANSTMGEVTLSQIIEKGPVILALYYADFTSG